MLEGFSFEKNPKASGKKESSQPTTSKGKASEKRKADSGSTQPEGEASSKRIKSKRTHFTFVL